jgi:quinoprotein glucose dehydrogenase
MIVRRSGQILYPVHVLFFGLLILAVSGSLLFSRRGHAADTAAQNGNWPAYGRDAGGSRYSPLDQINRDQVSKLKNAWTYHTGAAEVKATAANKAAFEYTPNKVDGTI